MTDYDRPPQPDEYFEYYSKYIDRVPAGDIRELMEQQIDELRGLLGGVPEADASMPHPPYTWTLKQVLGHLIDAERIFAERLHHFAMGDLQPLPGMNQEDYVARADYASPSLGALLEELLLLRRANALLLRRLQPADWSQRGVASGHAVTVRALAWMLVGHIEHHLVIVRQRLGLTPAL